jgi:hypothetical protein
MEETTASKFDVKRVVITNNGDYLLEGTVTPGIMSVPYKHINSFIKGVQRGVSFQIPQNEFGVELDAANPIVSMLKASVGQSVTVLEAQKTVKGTVLGVHTPEPRKEDGGAMLAQRELWLRGAGGEIFCAKIQDTSLVTFTDELYQRRFEDMLANARMKKDPERGVAVSLRDSRVNKMHFRMRATESFAEPKMTCVLNLDTTTLSIYMTIYNMSPYKWGEDERGVDVTIAPSMNEPIDVQFYPDDSDENPVYNDYAPMYSEHHLKSIAANKAPRRDMVKSRVVAPKPQKQLESQPRERPNILLKDVVLDAKSAAKVLLEEVLGIEMQRKNCQPLDGNRPRLEKIF